MNSENFIQGEGIYFRELRRSDLDGDWYKWLNNPIITAYQNKGIFPNTFEKQLDYFNKVNSSKNDVVLAIIENSSEKHIGNVGLHKIDWVHRSAELGILIGDKSSWGKKYGKKAWELITNYGFNVLNLHRIYALVMKDNIASSKCALASNFVKEGCISDVLYKNGKYNDLIYYNRIRNY